MGERLTCGDGAQAGPALLSEEQAAAVLLQLSADYGMAAVRSKWEGLTPMQVKANLAKRLGRFSWAAILRGLDLAPARHPDYPPNSGQLAALCESCEPVRPFAALPAPELGTAEIAERRIAAERAAGSVAAPKRGDRDWIAARISGVTKAGFHLHGSPYGVSLAMSVPEVAA